MKNSFKMIYKKLIHYNLTGARVSQTENWVFRVSLDGWWLFSYFPQLKYQHYLIKTKILLK